MNLSERLTMLRQIKNVGQKVLAAYLEVSVGTVSNYENGVHQPDLDTLCKFAEYYNVTMDYLAGRSAHSTSALSSCECSISMELREKIFLETAKLSQNNLHTLEWFARLLEDNEITVQMTDAALYIPEQTPRTTHTQTGRSSVSRQSKAQ